MIDRISGGCGPRATLARARAASRRPERGRSSRGDRCWVPRVPFVTAESYRDDACSCRYDTGTGCLPVSCNPSTNDVVMGRSRHFATTSLAHTRPADLIPAAREHVAVPAVAGRFDIGAQLAKELEARRLARMG